MSLKDKFAEIVGPAYVKDAPADLEAYGQDWTRAVEPQPRLAVLPGSTKETAQVLRFCFDNHLAVVPSGGRTGLAGAAVAANDEIVVAMDRMNRISKVDEVGLTIEVEAGVTTQAVQHAANDVDLFFALDLAAKGSSQIGGNIATNAGGTKLIRYGGMREQVLGLEVVLADGRILDMNTSIRKNNSGYDLKQIFIGSEGTLGVVTRATLRLMPKPKDLQLICMGVSGFEDVPKILRRVNKLALCPTAFEFFSQRAMDLSLTYHSELRQPLSEACPYYVLLEIENYGDASALLEKLVEVLFEESCVVDAVIAQSSQQFHELWGLRENISESISMHGWVRKNDISVPIDQLDRFVARMDKIVNEADSSVELVLFGHIGDGNIHINYIAEKSLAKDQFDKEAKYIESEIFSLLPEFRGSISAEHGIGTLKKPDLHLCRSEDELEIMRQLKQVFDGRGLMNPGKIF